MSMLTPDDLKTFRERLESERAAVLARIAERSSAVERTVRDEEGVGDTSDEGALLTEREQSLGTEDLDRQTLEQIERALRRVDEGTYGVSEVSGRPIPRERLDAVPEATTLADEELPPS
jgi:DnaK suppressor protein